jgi:ribosomal protein S18 acetylase RimI-like enzyme
MKRENAMEIREAAFCDLVGLLELYNELHDNAMPLFDERLYSLWERILGDKDQHILLGMAGESIVSSCVLVIVPNLTRNQRPYALVENVVTHALHRKRGYAAALLDHAKEIAKQENCYKIMLMTSAKDEATLRFYEKAGYNSRDKTAFIQWL